MHNLNKRVVYVLSLAAWLWLSAAAVFFLISILSRSQANPIFLKLAITSLVLFSFCLLGVIGFRDELIITRPWSIACSLIHGGMVSFAMCYFWEIRPIEIWFFFLFITPYIWAGIEEWEEKGRYIQSDRKWFFIDWMISKTEGTYQSLHIR